MSNKVGNEESPQVNTAAATGLSNLPFQHWNIDSGATDHITSSSFRLLVHNNGRQSVLPVRLPSGETTPIVDIGTLPLNVLYVPFT